MKPHLPTRQTMAECNLAAICFLVLAIVCATVSIVHASPPELTDRGTHLTFAPETPEVEIGLPQSGYWLIREDDSMFAPYKNDILKKWQDALRERGITDQAELQLLTAQALRENGSLSPTRIGDSGCSLGLPQRHFCSAANGMTAKQALKKWPEWHDLDFQINWFADAMKRNLDLENEQIKWAIIRHNRPASAAKKETTKYWTDVNNRLVSIEWKP